MKLEVKFLKWSAGIPVAMLNEKTAQKLGVRLKDRVSLKTSSKEISTIVDIVGDLIETDEIAVSNEIKKILNVKKGQDIDVTLSLPPKSLKFIKEKLNGKILSKQKIKSIICDIVKNSLSEAEIALFVAAMYKHGMTIHETVSLIEAILETGHKLGLRKKFIADKHSIGGVAGRTTPIVVSICASAGLTMPKTSSRAITSPAGTADAMETIAEVNFSMQEIKNIINKTGACIVWGGGLEMVPADSKIIQVEKMLNIDPEAQLLASIMSKKLSVGSKYLVIHIPYGNSAKVNRKKAKRLKKNFESLGKHFGKKIICVLVKNKGPLGDGIGPVLEMIDVLKVLDPQQKGPRDLQTKSLLLAGKLLELTGKAKRNKGYFLAEEILESGKAFAKFKQIIKAQKGKTDFSKLKPAEFKKDIHSKKSGRILEINNKIINSIAILAGCPTDKDSGVYLYFHPGEKVKKGEKLFTIYSETKPRLKQAYNFASENNPIILR